MAELAPGYDVPDFTTQISGRLEYPIASGSFSEVYLLTIESNEGTMEVAVKVFKIDHRRAMEKIQHTMHRELKVWLRLSKHPTIVPLLGIAHVGSLLPALISQWMPSETLDIYLEKQGEITASAKVELAKGVADGLEYLHSENVVHGDLHPGNVLIDGSGHPRLADFGLATVAGDAELQLSITTASRVLDPRWRAPEVIGIECDPRRPTIKSDVYSFGGVMFFIVSGVIPWKEQKRPYPIIVELSKRATPARPNNISDDDWNLIQQCWCWDPVGRPEATEVIRCIAPKTTTILEETKMAGSTIQTILPKMAAMIKDDTTFSMSDTTARPEGLQFNRYHVPPKTHKTIVLFGETGAGESSLINLMAGKDVAYTSPDMGPRCCTMHWQQYDINFGNTHYKVFDTVGLEQPQLGMREYLECVENAYRFIDELDKQGGIDLLLFCVRAGRIVATLQANYRLFHEILCDKQVPIVLAITNLEREARMEDWWDRNKHALDRHQVLVDGHACITAANRLDGRHRDLYEESRVTIRNVVAKFTADGQKQAWIGGDRQLVSLMRKLKELLVVKSWSVKDIIPHLTKRRGLSRDVAKTLTKMIKQDLEAT